jgi:VWFA-related protein
VAAAAGQFRTKTEAVRVDVLVTNGSKPVGGLRAEDFELLDNGVPQTIENMTIEEVPFSMLLALDTSDSMRGRSLADLKAAATSAMNLMGASDRAAVLTFSDVLRHAPRWLPKGAALEKAIDEVQASGATSLFDAAFASLLLRDPEAGRRSVMLLFSDGEDTSSWLPAAAAVEKAGRTEIVVYTVYLGAPKGRDADQDRATLANGRPNSPAAAAAPVNNRRLLFRSGIRLSPGAVMIEQSPFLTEIAERTGGEALVADTGGKLREAFERIVADFRSRYLLSYVPSGVDATGWHKLDVKLKNRAGRVKARRGYERSGESRP